MKNIIFILTIGLVSTLVVGCGEPDEVEKKLPSKHEDCGGSAVKNRYVIFYNDGSWETVENPSREDFKWNYIAPRVKSINFIEYDQRVFTREQEISIQPQAVFDNWGPENIGAPIAWDRGLRGENVTVAIVDSGMDLFHPQLSGNIAFNSGETGNDGAGQDKRTNGIDDDSNGYVDDYTGYDFLNKTGQMTDSDGHGTHIAGIIAAYHTAKEIRDDVMQGIAPRAKILPLKFLSENGGFLSDAMRAIDYAVAAGAKVVNASWGGPTCSRSLQEKMSELGKANILLVVAAGNSRRDLERSPEYPAAFNLPLQITVGSVGSSGLMADHSNYSPNLVHLFAPGLQIRSTYPGNRYATFSGTSMATPFVVGAAALILSGLPDLSTESLKQMLLRAVIHNSNYQNVTQGRLNFSSISSELP